MTAAFIGTGGDPGHKPARDLYEALGYQRFPSVQYFRVLADQDITFQALASAALGCILNCMVQYSSERLDASFGAISDATRRGVLERLGRGDASITDLAQAFDMTLTGMRKHVGVLEQVELVTTAKVGRVRTCQLGPRRLEDETAWIERHRRLWDSRFAELDNVLEELKRKEKVNGRNKNK